MRAFVASGWECGGCERHWEVAVLPTIRVGQGQPGLVVLSSVRPAG